MTSRIIDLDTLKDRSAEELLREVADSGATFHVVLDKRKSVDIVPSPGLEDLPVLPGRIPSGWKDAVYGE